MLYLRGAWSCPASNPKTTDETWDLAFMSKEEFIAKYGKDRYENLNGSEEGQ